MTHFEFIKNSFDVIAVDEKSQSILFDAYGERCCEINGVPFSCSTVEEFWEMVEMFEGEDFQE